MLKNTNKLAIAFGALLLSSTLSFGFGGTLSGITTTTTDTWNTTPSIVAGQTYQEQIDAQAPDAIEDIDRNAVEKPDDNGLYGAGSTITSNAVIVPPSPKVVTNNYHKTYHQEPIWGAWTRGGGWYNYTHKKIKKNRFSITVDGFGRVASWKQWTGCSRCSSNLKNRVWSSNGGKSQIVAYPLCHQPYVSDGCKHDGNLFIRSVVN